MSGSRSCAGVAAARGRESGFSLVAAIFLIVVLAALAAFAVQVGMSQYQTTDLALLEARTQSAAQAGIEYAANQALRGPRTCLVNSPPLSLTQGALAGYVVEVGCLATPHSIYPPAPPPPAAPITYTAYALTATAVHGTYGKPGYVVRTVRRNVTDAPP